MEEQRYKLGRRNFLKTAGAAGLGSVFTSAKAVFGANEPNAPVKTRKPEFPQVPKRKLGKTGVEVTRLAIGVTFNALENQILLRNAIQWGVNYWDTCPYYAGGNGQLGIGKFLSKNPGVREKIFLASLSGTTTHSPKIMDEANVEHNLQTSLQNMNTEYLDLYYGVYGMTDPSQLTEEVRQWAQNAKKRKLIRFFGISTHKNMAQCLMAASKLDWIDVIMTAYNFRLVNDAKLQAAIEACHKAGIGLVAMKTLGLWSMDGHGKIPEAEEYEKMVGHFRQSGFTDAQAKIKLVLENKKFTTACVGMRSVAVLTSNVAAVLDKTKLTQEDTNVLGEYAKTTCRGYCAGCANICDSALPDLPYVSDIMRYLMYYNNYGDRDRARELFAKIPANVRNKLLRTDYSIAETHCPQHIPISKLITEAVRKLA